MEDDDEFGDLYTDVLRPYAASSSPQPLQSSSTSLPLHRPIDFDFRADDSDVASAPLQPRNQNLAYQPDDPANSASADGREGVLGSGPRVLEGKDVELAKRDSQDVESGFDRVDSKGDEKDVDLKEKVVNFDIEEGKAGIMDVDSSLDPLISGLSAVGELNQENLENPRRNDGVSGGAGAEEGDDWDSDSEDDLQIVLNDKNQPHETMAAMEGGDDEDDDDPSQALEEQEWGEEAAALGPEGERKEAGEAGIANSGVAAVVPKIGYSSHGYHHPFHSQFKYVRPGAAVISGATTVDPGGAAGQVHPLANMGPVAGRGRGDWRPTGIRNDPSMQKSFYPGFGLPGWGNNMPGRGFGGGLEFTLPSHKTIFEVVIDGFEEKPWRYPDVDASDFFNFGLNEESWKDYCKKLEQLRLESTMQRKIRVYESGRAEQDYDPDLPPELAAATSMRDVPADNANLGKSDGWQGDLMKGSTRPRPPVPTGRAIQVGGGDGERLPSITRLSRMRDSDSIIEIVCQDDDDSFAGNGVLDRPDNDIPGGNRREDHVAEEVIAQIDTEYFDGFPRTYNGRKVELIGRGAPFIYSDHDNISEGNGSLPIPTKVPVQCSPGSRMQNPVNFTTTREERQVQGGARNRSPPMTPVRIARDKRFVDNQNEESVENMDDTHSSLLSSPVKVGAASESSVEDKDALHDELLLAEGGPGVEKEDMNLNTVATNDSLKDEKLLHSVRQQNLSSQVEQPVLQEPDDGDDSKAAISSENSKARSGSSRDNQKWQDGVEEEVIQGGRPTRMGNIKRNLDENEQSSRTKDHSLRQEIERNRTVVRGREDSYPHRDWDPSSAQHSHMKTEGLNRKKERDNSDGAWQQGDDNPHSRNIKIEDTRKRERGDEIGSRNRNKIRGSERSDKEEYLPLRKQLDNGSYKVHYDKDISSQHGRRNDNLKRRFENTDDYNSQRRRGDEYIGRDHTNREKFLHGHRENISRRKRERDEFLDRRKGDDQQRIRDSLDDHHSVRHKDEGRSQRERGERQKEREDWHRPKQFHEGNPSKRERGGERGLVRSERTADDSVWVGHARVKDEHKGSDKEYQYKDTVRHSEQQKGRYWTEDENLSQHRGHEDVYGCGNQFSNEEKKSRQERSSTRNDHAANASNNRGIVENMHKEARKSKESDGGDHNTQGPSKRNRGGQSGQISETGLKDASERGIGEHRILLHRHSSRKLREGTSSDDEQQDSRRGRSKLERRIGHKETDYSFNSKSSSSLKEIDENNDVRSSEASKLPDESAKAVEMVDNQHPLTVEKDDGDREIKDSNVKPTEDQHLDTVEKLKQRSKRFKLPMPIEKEALAIKKMESEALPCAKSETPANSAIKQERPARKRRWLSN